jgi:hypothetical protein
VLFGLVLRLYQADSLCVNAENSEDSIDSCCAVFLDATISHGTATCNVAKMRCALPLSAFLLRRIRLRLILRLFASIFGPLMLAKLQLVCVVLLGLFGLFGAPGAQAQVPDDGVTGFNYAYSVFVGTGAYQFNESTIYILRVPVELDLVPADFEQGKVGYRLLLPMSVGIANLNEIDDIPDLRFSDAQTFAVTPGVEVLVPLRRNWLLKP